MNVILTGFMGTGKTTVGRRVAERLKAPFVDIDREIEKETGLTVAEIFESEGEARFRRIESEIIARIAARDGSVIATGGGALLKPENREVLERQGLLICLTAKMATLLERLQGDVTRPLLAGERIEDRLARLMKEREAVYALCPHHVATDGKTIIEVAEEIVRLVQPRWQPAK